MRVPLHQTNQGLPALVASLDEVLAAATVSSSTSPCASWSAGRCPRSLCPAAKEWITPRGRTAPEGLAVGQSGRRVVLVLRLLLGVEVVEVAEELVEAVVGGQVLVAVAEVVLAELAGGVALRLEQAGDGRVFFLQPCSAPGRPTLVRPVRNTLWPVMNEARPAVQDCSP
jgi:hypothetical protein